MCILCVVQKWSRRVVSMLPWLVIPLIGLWALSQLLPPGLRFEITSPRLACVLVLLGTLFWYEIVLPQLSVYWARRSARIRERQRIQAIEMQKLRKTATRRCRNCLTPYRDQNPGGGKFMCSYCGHVSKRPVLDIPGPPGSSGIISNLVKKNSWFCSQDYSAEGSGNWVAPVPRYWVNDGKEQCLTEKSYSGAAVFTWKLLSSVFSCVRWFCRKVLRLGSHVEDGSSDSDHKGLSRKGENGANCQESKGEKAKRKAEEKRQARLEKEMLEEEERKQREEIARLVEERRKLRDEKLEAEKERLKVLAADGERDSRKESERRKQDRRKEKDKGSSKRNSDGEDLERRVNRETEKKHEFDKKGENEKRDSSKPTTESRKMSMEAVHSVKGVANKYKYFDRFRGSFLSSSRGFHGTTFFGKGSHNPTAPPTKSTKSIGGFVDHIQSSGNKSEGHAAGPVIGKASANGDTKSSGTTYSQPVANDLQPRTTTLKKSWHQLFTRSSAISPCPDANAMKKFDQMGQPEAQISQLLDQKVQSHPLHDQFQFGQSLGFTAYPLMNGSLAGNSVSPLFADSRFPIGGELDHNFTTEEAELFEDPCYVPDPASLLGPVSESLDEFAGDPGTGFITDYQSEPPHILKNRFDSVEANKPSPIESPMSKLRTSGEKHNTSGPCTPKSRDQGASPVGEPSNVSEQGTWQMWSSTLYPDGRDLVGGPASWLLPLGQNKSNHEEIVHPPPHSSIVSHGLDANILQSSFNHSQKAHVGNQKGGTFSPFTPILSKNDPWSQGSIFHPLPGDAENHFPSLNFHDNASQSEKAYESPKTSAVSHPFDHYPASVWTKRNWAVPDEDDAGNSNVIGSHIGGFLSANPDVQSGLSVERGYGSGSVGNGYNVTDRETVSS
uniref:Stress response protein NST1 n=1 Tax=Anthurium amnicola TaxID=1678845 RepID=A0A1D1YJI1_9ARAE